MAQFRFKLFAILFLQAFGYASFSQNTPENLKTALVYRIANCVKWNADTSSVFKIGILSDNQTLIQKFNELAKVAKINKKHIQIFNFSNEKGLQTINLLYVDANYNQSISLINNKISKQNTLLVSEEYYQPGEIMINLRLDKNTNNYSFDYNRANILFAGLDLTDEIVLLKGSEIEIRAIYIQAKKLWDNEISVVADLKKKADIQNKNLSLQKDSILRMKLTIDEIQNKISKQLYVLAQKDSISTDLNRKIDEQETELKLNVRQIAGLTNQRNNWELLIRNQQSKINQQLMFSDSLSKNIHQKQIELFNQNKALNEKETVIQKQSNWLYISVIIILIVIFSILFVFRAYIVNRKAKLKIAEQNEKLETTLEKLQNMQQQLIQSEKMASLGVFVAGIAHEINNPLNFISTGIDGIEKVMTKVTTLSNELNALTVDSKSEDIQKLMDLKQKLKFQRSLDAMPEILANIKIGISRTVEITNGLRLYARMDKEEKSLFDVNQIMNTALLLIKPHLNSQINIVLNYGYLPQTKVFPGKLSQVFVNVLSNAINSIREQNDPSQKPSINITTHEIGGKIVIEIADTGKGISPQVMNKLFDPFFTTKTVGKGTGLGMSISLSVIQAHNGKISARNNNDKGATFTIEIPIQND